MTSGICALSRECKGTQSLTTNTVIPKRHCYIIIKSYQRFHLNNGHYSKFYRGVSQGCPISPYLLLFAGCTFNVAVLLCMLIIWRYSESKDFLIFFTVDRYRNDNHPIDTTFNDNC